MQKIYKLHISPLTPPEYRWEKEFRGIYSVLQG